MESRNKEDIGYADFNKETDEIRVKIANIYCSFPVKTTQEDAEKNMLEYINVGLYQFLTDKGFTNLSNKNFIELINYKIGNKDRADRTIEEIYFQVPTSHVIYKAEGSFGLHVEGSVWDNPPDISKIAFKLHEILAIIRGEDRAPYLGQIACAMNEAILGNHVEAEGMLNQVKLKYTESKFSLQRKEYIRQNSLVMGGLLVVAILLHFYNNNVFDLELLNVIFFGAIGAYLSILLKVENNFEGFEKSTYLSGINRLLIGVFGSLLIYLAIKSNLAFGLLGANKESIYLAATCGGFSERVITIIVNKVLSKEETKAT